MVSLIRQRNIKPGFVENASPCYPQKYTMSAMVIAANLLNNSFFSVTSIPWLTH